jgi:protein-S-isoprenylcysteine O-methyltransferase Ste14
VSRRAINGHLLAWGVKAFFLPFMLGGAPGGFGGFVRTDLLASLTDPVSLARMLIGFMFLVDMAVATVGYVLTFRPLDAHIRSANPFAAAWMPALICYPPFVLMTEGGPLDYHQGTGDWSWWLQGHPYLQALVGAVLVGLTAIYAWATLAFGPRFSNLTHRGILTHGPYRWARHPAYLSKNLFWWLATLPMLTTGSPVDAARATLLLGLVSGVYYWRAKTEERHLRRDPLYREYSAWIDRNGLFVRRQKLSSA